MPLNKLLLIPVFFVFIGCATVPKYDRSDFTAIKTLNDLNGEYDNYPLADTVRDYQTISRIINWKANKTDTAKVLKIEIDASESSLKLITHKSNGEHAVKNIRGKLTEHGFVKLKNRNLRLTGIPYILGYYDLKKVELGLTKEKDLIINGVEKGEGALLFIFGYGPPKHEFQFTYRRK